MATFKPGPDAVRTHSTKEQGEVQDELDQFLQQMRESARDKIREAVQQAGDGVGDVIVAEGLRVTKPLKDMASGFGAVFGDYLAESLRRRTNQPPSESDEGTVGSNADDDDLADPWGDDFYEGEDD